MFLLLWDWSPLLLLILLGITVALSLSVSNVNAVTVNNTDFSIQVPNGWVYKEHSFFANGTDLTPNEFADFLITDNVSAISDALHGGVMVELARDPSFTIKNAPVEIYAKYASKVVNNLFPTYENATIGGERAIKVFVNSTDIASRVGMTNVPVSHNSISYFVMHDDKPYFLNYMANAKYYQKYLPQFEQMVKTFKFTK